MIFSIILEKSSSTPIYQQLGDALLDLIEKGIIAPNSKLPPIRKMADNLKINSSTVVNAYRYLESKHVVYSVIGSGTYASPLKVENLPIPVISEKPKENKLSSTGNINFATTSVPPEFFPVEHFKDIFNEVLDRDLGKAFSYHEPKGYEPLIESISTVILKDLGINWAIENTMIVSGAQQGMDIVSKAVINTGDFVFVEKPSYWGAVGAFLSRNAKIIQIPLLTDGMDLEMLENYLKIYKPKLIYIMTYFQTPTGTCYSVENKKKILQLADKYDTYIVEEDNLSDFNFSDEKIIPLKALDYKNRVIFIKSLSKILMPGLRIGFIVAPKKIIDKALNAKQITDIASDGFIMRACDLFLRKNLWNIQKEKIKEIYKKKYELLTKNIDDKLGDKIIYNKPNGGLSIWFSINKDINCDDFMENLSKSDVILSPGSVFYIDKEKAAFDFYRLGFSAASDKEIVKGIEIIEDVLKNY